MIPALTPRGNGHQFVCYADCCSGVPGAPHEKTFAAVNRVVARLRPRPEFICFPGDEVIGLTADADELREQWRYWCDQEMAWLDREAIPIYHTTGNHTTYDPMSEEVFRQVMASLPGNGPPGQKQLSYYVRREDLLVIAVNTLWSGLGGEGRVEIDWLAQTLDEHTDAKYKLVMGHHPVHPVNGFSGSYQRELAPDNGREFWKVLVEHDVLAYLCSHILAFDVQVHMGVLQILTAGAGTAHRMPEGIEYLHCLQAAVDDRGLRYQVLDTDGRVREWLSWPPELLPTSGWSDLKPGDNLAPVVEKESSEQASAQIVVWRFQGESVQDGLGTPQTLLSGWRPGPSLPPLWIGLNGQEQRLSLTLSPAAGRSPHLWLGPALAAGEPFDIQIAIHSGMGPGGVLWRSSNGGPWSSMEAASPWGAERLSWPERWRIGYERGGESDRPFRGRGLRVSWQAQTETLSVP